MENKLYPKLLGFRLRAYNDHDLNILIFSYVFLYPFGTYPDKSITYHQFIYLWMNVTPKNIVLIEKPAYTFP